MMTRLAPATPEELTNAGDPLYGVRLILGIGFLSILALTPNLWLSSRAIPLVPLIPLIGPFPHPLDIAFLVVLILSVLYSLLRRSAGVLFLIAALLAVAGVQDQNRIMPWGYQLFVMYLVCGMGLLSPRTHERQATTRNLLRIILICIYFWSGVLKINRAFLHVVAPSFLEPLSRLGFPSDVIDVLTVLFGIVAPFFEAGLAVALLFPASRKVAIVGIVCMHLLILGALGPLGVSYNSSVWPWNIMMMVLVPVLLWRDAPYVPDLLPLKRTFVTVGVLLAVGVLPALRIVHRWDTYLSFGMYVGNTPTGVVLITPEGVDKLPSDLRRHAVEGSPEGTHYEVSMHKWLLAELNSPPYPETRILLALAQWWCDLKLPPNSLLIEINSWSSPTQRRPLSTVYECSNGTLRRRAQ